MGRWFATLLICFLFSFGISRADDLRELRIVVYTQCKVSAGKKADIAHQFERVSQSMQDKAGIRQKIVGWEERCFPVAQSAGMVMAQMKAELGLGDQYDVAVAFTGMTPWGYTANLLSLPSSLGATDTQHFRFIVIREQWDSVLEHELWHVFLHGHSEGLNAPVVIKLPFGPPLVVQFTKVWVSEYFNNIYRGKSTVFQIKVALGVMGGVQVELIEVLKGPTIYEEFLEKKGEGLHHLGFLVDNMDALIEAFRKMGISVSQSGERVGLRWAYLDTENLLQVIFELLEKKETA